MHSHVHALGQCRKVIREHGLRPVISGDTAGAAREVAESGDLTQAAISPPLAAETYGLEVLARDVEDEEHNTTRFVVLSRELVEAPPGNGPVVTSFIFNVRNLPAALYKALGGFATNGVNMTKLESYMVGGHFTATQFLAEVDGHPEDPGLKRALEELSFFTTDVKILGVYPADCVPVCVISSGPGSGLVRRWKVRTSARPGVEDVARPHSSRRGLPCAPPTSTSLTCIAGLVAVQAAVIAVCAVVGLLHWIARTATR